jgi:outer membrane receptor protein involved in Fe transport
MVRVPGHPALRPVVLALALACAASWELRAEGEAGAIRGTVYDKDFEAPLSAVRVSVAGTLLTVATATDGHFLIERIPPGSYTLSFSKDGYERQVVAGVVVSAGQVTEVRADLASEVVDMEELVVTGTDLLANSDLGLLEIRQASVAMQDAISSELLRRSGVSDLAGALKLVVGTSVVGGKYAAVRGLSDRYVGTTLNGVRVPSSDPRRRAVQVDQFPTGTIDTVTVTKTFTPDLQGDFTGGGIDIKTRSIPDGRVLSISAALENNSLATGNGDVLTYDGGGTGALGNDHGEHDLPEGAEATLPTLPRFRANPSAADLEASKSYDRLVRSFTPVMGVSREAPERNYSFSLVTGNRWNTGRGVMGALGALTTSRKHDFYEGGANNSALVSVAGQPIGVTRPRDESLGTDTLLLGGLGTVVWRPLPGQELSARYILNQATEDEARFQQEDRGFPSVEQNQSLRYSERRVTSIQLHGTHALGTHATGTTAESEGARSRGTTIDWVAATNRTRQDEPDVRFFRNVYNFDSLSGEAPSNSTEADNTRRIFRNIEEDNKVGGLNGTFPFQRGGDLEGRFKIGALLDRTDRTSTQRSFTYRFPNQFGPASNPAAQHNRSLARFIGSDPDQLWTDVFLEPDRIGLATNSPPAPNQLLWIIVPLGDDVDYTGEQKIDGYYAMADLPLTAKLKWIGGARRETTSLSVVPKNKAFGKVEIIEIQDSGDRGIVRVPEDEATVEIKDTALLPSIGLIYEIVPNMNLRASWARTLARPNFRELAPVATEEFIFGDEFIGNPALTLSKISNFDLRWEWFRRSGELLSFGAFYKQLKNPIEMISFSAGGRSFIQPVNYDQGRVYGLEIEARGPLDTFGGWLHGVDAGMNLSLFRSSVDVPVSERISLSDFGLAEDTRRLQGQPDYVFNFNLSYDNDRTGTSGGLFYNVVGETLLTGAARGVDGGNPDVFERPFHALDLRLSQKVGKEFALSLKVGNILRSERRSVYRTPDGDEAVKSQRPTALLLSVGGTLTW